ncbi:hypothetical protein K8R62_03490 [bacterium]|nr:hypothetical protein [bacterium]
MKEKFAIMVEDYNVPPTPWYIINLEVFSNGIKEASKGKVDIDTLFIFEKNKVTWGAKMSEFDNGGIYFSEKINNDKKYQKKIIEKHYKYLEEIKKFADKLIKTDFSKKSNKELFRIYSCFYNLYSKTQTEGVIVAMLDMGDKKLSDRVSEEIRSKFNFKDHDIIFSKLLTPNKELYYGKENLAVLKAARKIQEDSEKKRKYQKVKKLNDLPNNLKSIFKSLAKKYGWLQYYYVGPSAGVEYYFDLVKRKLNSNVSKEIKDRRNEENKLKNFQKRYENNFSSELTEKINILKEFTYLKEYRKEIQVYLLNFSIDEWFKEVARRFYLTPLQARYILKDEYRELLVDNKNVAGSNELNKRYNNFAYILKGGEIASYTGQKAKDCWNLFEKNKLEMKDNLKLEGSIAFPGKKKGIVKIINSTQDLNKFKDGNVLVSFSTNPYLMPAINKASAIVTNTGGVTCHAAIISRELKIPRVIGTKIATKILKDGDLVEVDANRGIVKIIK